MRLVEMTAEDVANFKRVTRSYSPRGSPSQVDQRSLAVLSKNKLVDVVLAEDEGIA
jgi:hypothetical protein